MLFHIVSLLREALFPIITGTVISARTYVLPPALWLSRRFDGGIKHMWVKGNTAVPSHPSVYSECQRADVTLRENTRGGPWWIPPCRCLSACLSVCLSGHVMESDDNRAARGVQRPRSTANLPGHLARLTLFKQVPRRLVSCLVKWLTFWFNQHPRLPDELDHYQKCTGSAMSLTCQNPTRLLIYLLHSPWEEHCNTVRA